MQTSSVYFKCFIAALGCLGLGFLSGYLTMDSVNGWYLTIEKPSWNPPGWLFGPVWSVLYLMMGVALGLVWHSTHALKRKAITLFVIQFALNFFWSFVFFNFHQIGWALVEIVLLLFFILWTTQVFYKIRPIAAYLMVPYKIWVSFASVLTGTLWVLNS